MSTDARPISIVVDIDGTLALRGARGPYQESRVGEDLPNAPVVAVVQAMRAAGYSVVVVSGRTDGCLDPTRTWLRTHLDFEPDALLMRRKGDSRKDSELKLEFLDRHIVPNYRVAFVIDDRQSVVDAWRSRGLVCFQVGPGDF